MAEEPRPGLLDWTARAVAGLALVVVGWAAVTAWGAVAHGHPAYAVLLVLTALGSVTVLWRSLTRPVARGRWRSVVRSVLLVLAAVWIVVVAWLRPFAAEEPALAAMRSDAAVTVSESMTAITMSPTREVSGTAVLFQPGARVEARAYAAVLRPLAEAGHPVVIVKQPFSIAFLATGALDGARGTLPDVDRWVVGGHSLGGVVASMAAESDVVAEPRAPVEGLLLFASYPASDLSAVDVEVESISGSKDGLSTPSDIDASRDQLPPEAGFTVVDGASHAYFGDYGPQPGDGVPSISHDDARDQISSAARTFVGSLD